MRSQVQQNCQKKRRCSFDEKTRIPRQERSIKTKKQIIDAAMKLFSEKGYHNTNSKEIASLAGVATGCFYAYFEDKRAVFIEALKLYLEQFNDRINSYLNEAIDPCKNRKGLLYGLIKCIIDAHSMFTGMHNELLSLRLEDDEIDMLLFENEKRSTENTYRQISRWKEKLKVPDLEASSVIVYNIIHRVVDIIVLKQSDVEGERLINETVEMLDKYLFM